MLLVEVSCFRHFTTASRLEYLQIEDGQRTQEFGCAMTAGRRCKYPNFKRPVQLVSITHIIPSDLAPSFVGNRNVVSLRPARLITVN